MYKYLLFDADNTLLDFNASERNALEFTLLDYDIAYTDDVYRKYHFINDSLWKKVEKGILTRKEVKTERFKQLFECLGIQWADIHKVSATFMSHISNQGIALKGAIETLIALEEKYKISIVTNGTAKVQLKRLTESGIIRHIDKLYMSEIIGFEKPDIEFFNAVISDIGDYDMANYLVIGDSLTADIAGAERIGMDSCYICQSSDETGEHIPKYIIKSIEELICLLL